MDLSRLKAGDRLPVGSRFSTVLPDMDFESYSEAGYTWDGKKWRVIDGAPGKCPSGIAAVGASVYARHPSTVPLCLAYDLKDGKGPRVWTFGGPDPTDLLDYIRSGGIIEAHNCLFEHEVWNHSAVRLLGWPPIAPRQLRCSQAKGQAFTLPGGLDKAAAAVGSPVQKLKDGKRLIDLFCTPVRAPNSPEGARIKPEEAPEDFALLLKYCAMDIEAEAQLSARCPDLSPEEVEVFLITLETNIRGVHIDALAVDNCIEIIKQARVKYETALPGLTGGLIERSTQIARIKAWCTEKGLPIPNTQAETVQAETAKFRQAAALPADMPPPPELAYYVNNQDVRQVLEAREYMGSASINKLFAMDLQRTATDRVHGLYTYCGGQRTGRMSGRSVQPQNLPASGPDIHVCSCATQYSAAVKSCPVCGAAPSGAAVEWGIEHVAPALGIIASRSLGAVEAHYGDAIDIILGCMRAMLTAGPGCELLSSDYSAIEAVVLAYLAGEEWRQEVFKTHGKIYEMSASKITGVPFAEFERHKAETGGHHPLRKKIGKVAELASGYQGWIGAWKQFGADKHFNDDKEIRDAIIKWRQESPAIVEYWGGQVREIGRYEFRYEMHGVEGAAVQAVLAPGQVFNVRGITFVVEADVLYIGLLSGRRIAYHSPRLEQSIDGYSKWVVWRLSYMGWNTNAKKGPTKTWMRIYTYGGMLVENITQATARDIFAFGIINLNQAGYPLVLTTHDEDTAEVQEGSGSVEGFEETMGTMPAWCSSWPIRAAGGWRGKRYRKD